MEEHLTIHNFGPIREAEIDVRDLTIFVGPQATGKSLAAQMLYFLRGIEDLLLPDISAPFDELEAVLSTLEWWFGNPCSVYAESGTLLRWHSTKRFLRDFKQVEEDIGAEQAIYEIQWDRQGAHLNEALKDRVRRWLESHNRAHLQEEPRGRLGIPSQVYIPVGRALYSFLSPYMLLSSRRRTEWPGYALKFYETLGMATRQLWKEQEQEKHELPQVSRETSFLRQRIDRIMKGRIRYGPDTVLLEVGQKLLNPTTIAAGQMEIWPFWAIMEVGFRPGSLPISFSPPLTPVYFEEPEAHLHPAAQRSVMEIIAYMVQKGAPLFLLTTHSPYILYAVNNFLMAQKVLKAGRTLPDDVPPETALRPDQVAAYCFSPDGIVHDIMDAEVGLIDEDELDRVAGELGATFTDLQELLEGWE